MSDEKATHRRGRGGSDARRARRDGARIEQFPFITRRIPVTEVLSAEGLEIIEANAETILEEIGIEFREDAEALDCVDAVEHARVIVARGTGADRQRRAYDEARAAGADHDAALRRVVDHLIEDSMVGLDPPP